MPRSIHGGRHELGQNHLRHRPTLDRIVQLVGATRGDILEIGAGDGALTRGLARLGRPLTAIDIDEHRVRALARDLPGVDVVHADALHHPIRHRVVVGNLPFHLTTPILRRLLRETTWRDAVVVTQWEVARKRAGVGGSTLLTAQSGPWFDTDLVARVPARGFAPVPSVDGGVLRMRRRRHPLVVEAERAAFARFVAAVFTGRGSGLARIVANAAGVSIRTGRDALRAAGVAATALPRDLGAAEWAAVWRAVRAG